LGEGGKRGIGGWRCWERGIRGYKQGIRRGRFERGLGRREGDKWGRKLR